MCAGQIEGKVRARTQEVLGLCNTREMGGRPRGGLGSRWARSGDVLHVALLWLKPAPSPQQWLPWSLLPPGLPQPLSLSVLGSRSLALFFSLTTIWFSPPSLPVFELSDLPPSSVCLHLLHLGLCLSVSVGHSDSLPHSLATPPNVCGSHSLQHSTCLYVCLSLDLCLSLWVSLQDPLSRSLYFVSHSVTVPSLLSVFLSVSCSLHPPPDLPAPCPPSPPVYPKLHPLCLSLGSFSPFSHPSWWCNPAT